MYAYDELDRTLINERVSEFRDQVKRRLSGELTEDEFKMLRLQNGVYLQLHAYMFRVAIPYGTLSSKQLRRLAHVARRYDRGYGHFTTRQNIQYNWIKLADCQMRWPISPRSASTPCRPRATTPAMSPPTNGRGGARRDRGSPHLVELLRQYTTLHPEFSFLPRKFKFAITASEHDRAAIKVHDIGLRCTRTPKARPDSSAGRRRLGRTPFIAKTIKSFVPAVIC